MKIKSVCELTGLTDRTIRYYIEEKLVTPLYTENYLGRKTYNFSEKDIKELNDIAVLRKFDFTLNEIKSVINDAETSKIILSNVKDRTAQAVLDGQSILSVLSQISVEKAYTMAELAEELSKVSLNLPEHRETIKTNIVKTVLSILKTIVIFAIVWLPIALSLFGVIISINDYHYPVFEPVAIVLTIVSFLPSIAVLTVSKTKLKWKKIAQRFLLVFCVLSIPMLQNIRQHVIIIIYYYDLPDEGDELRYLEVGTNDDGTIHVARIVDDFMYIDTVFSVDK